MNNKKFQRTKEDFVCENCGQEVKGNGYTNHCPACLWSKHVDINPGDRMGKCGGMMEPYSIETKKDLQVIIHKCALCNFKHRNKVINTDNFERVLEVSKKVN